MVKTTRTCALLSLLVTLSLQAQNNKIVGLIRVRNEANTIEQHLKALACYTHALVVLNNASGDKTVDVIRSLQNECSIEKILHKSFWYEDDAADYNRMLFVGREIGGTHFIVLNSDELFSANCQDNNLLKEKILSLQPGDQLVANKIRLWMELDRYRVDGGYSIEAVAFCDDGTAKFSDDARLPKNLCGEKVKLLPFHRYGVLSCQNVDWTNITIKTIWKKCFERITWPSKPAQELNEKYQRPAIDSSIRIMKAPHYWFDSYRFFDKTLYEKRNDWHESQIKQWVHQYGQNFFDGLGFALHTN